MAQDSKSIRSINISDEVWEDVIEAAETEDRSASQMVEKFCKLALAERKRQALKSKKLRAERNKKEK